MPHQDKAYLCKLTTVCFGMCPGEGVRSLGASLSRMPAIPDAMVIIVPADTKPATLCNWGHINLRQCDKRLAYNGECG